MNYLNVAQLWCSVKNRTASSLPSLTCRWTCTHWRQWPSGRTPTASAWCWMSCGGSWRVRRTWSSLSHQRARSTPTEPLHLLPPSLVSFVFLHYHVQCDIPPTHTHTHSHKHTLKVFIKVIQESAPCLPWLKLLGDMTCHCWWTLLPHPSPPASHTHSYTHSYQMWSCEVLYILLIFLLLYYYYYYYLLKMQIVQ